MIKLLALDLDGTLLNSRGEISTQNIEAIQQAERQGVLVTIATGRRFRDALPVAEQLKLNAPVICHNGALLKYADTLETVHASILGQATVREVLRVGKKFGGNALLSADPNGKGVLFYDSLSDDNIPLQKYVAWSKRLHGSEAEEAVHQVENLETIVETVETVHISFSGRLAPMAGLEMILRGE